jgi:hypothetical protein
MSKIEKLTPEQVAKQPEYVEKWIGIGTDTSRLDPIRTEKTINNFRKLIGLDDNVPLFIFDNPIECWAACCLHEMGVADEDLREETLSIFNGNPKGYKIPSPTTPWATGSFFASVFSFYDYMIEEVGVEIDTNLYAKYKTWEATSQLGYIYPLQKLTVVSEKPTAIHLNENNVAHCDGGPAIQYAGHGDMKIYILNGVRVPQWLAETPADQIDIERYTELQNADVKGEFVRKIGIDRFLEKGEIVDSYENYEPHCPPLWAASQYELVDMSVMFDALDYAPYLKMVNQTTGIFHMEGVSPECHTISDALKERFGGRDFAIKSIA